MSGPRTQLSNTSVETTRFRQTLGWQSVHPSDWRRIRTSHGFPAADGTFTQVQEVRQRRRGASRISSKHQITIPVDALRAAGLEIGERVVAHAEGPGKIVLERERDVLAEYAGAMTGVYEPGELEELRGEWG